MPTEQYLECGKIINTHGVRGTVKAESWCDGPEELAALPAVYLRRGAEFVRRDVLHAAVQKRFVLLTLSGTETLEDAVALKNRTIYADRADFKLPAGRCFICDLIGLPLLDADSGARYGTLREVINSGASDIYVVDTPVGDRMMPAVPEYIDRIEPDTAIYVRPIDGMFD